MQTEAGKMVNPCLKGMPPQTQKIPVGQMPAEAARKAETGKMANPCPEGMSPQMQKIPRRQKPVKTDRKKEIRVWLWMQKPVQTWQAQGMQLEKAPQEASAPMT